MILWAAIAVTLLAFSLRSSSPGGWRPEAWQIIRACDHLDWLILTKRPELIADRLPSNWGRGYPNVWLGTTIEDQSQLSRLEHLVKMLAAIRFISAEPLLGRSGLVDSSASSTG